MIEHAAALLAEIDPAGWSPAQRWTALIGAQGLAYATMITGFLAARAKLTTVDTKVEAVQQSADAAKIAVENSPTANGFADETKAQLQAILNGLVKVESKVDTHIADHASADVRRSRGN